MPASVQMGITEDVPGPRVGMEPAPRHLMTPMAVQLLSMLKLPQGALDDLIASRIAENPVLVKVPVRRCLRCGSWSRFAHCPFCERLATLPVFREPPSYESALEVLRRDARLRLPGELDAVLDAVLGHLDDRGLLDDDLATIAASLGRPEGDVRTVLGALRHAGPPGIAERDGISCLAAQATWHVARGGPPALTRIVPAHLEGVAAGDYSGIAQALGVPVSDVDAAVNFLRKRLRPFVTLEGAPTEQPPPVPPDVIVRRDSGNPDSLIVQVPGSRELGLDLDDELLRMKSVSVEAHAWLAGHAARASALLELIDRRASTLRRIAVAVVHAQRSFVLGGPEDHIPLTRTQIALALGLNVSTVSRAVHGKVVSLPGQRQEPLSAFFGSAVAVKTLLVQLLRAEAASRPDAYFADRLAAAGHPVARRTVAKYRQSLVREGWPW